jgi:hypothetical protein
VKASADASEADAEHRRVWKAILAAKDWPVPLSAPGPIPASALPYPWSLEGRDVA